jgi:phosphomevalonate kinase
MIKRYLIFLIQDEKVSIILPALLLPVSRDFYELLRDLCMRIDGGMFEFADTLYRKFLSADTVPRMISFLHLSYKMTELRTFSNIVVEKCLEYIWDVFTPGQVKNVQEWFISQIEKNAYFSSRAFSVKFVRTQGNICLYKYARTIGKKAVFLNVSSLKVSLITLLFVSYCAKTR